MSTHGSVAGPVASAGPVVAIEYFGHPYPGLARLVERIGGGALRGFLEKLTIDSISRRNPRNRDYMRALMASAGFSNPQLLTADADGSLDRGSLQQATTIVLLWPDGNGTGWRSIEQQVFSQTPNTTRIVVLNGRRRQFELSRSSWLGYLGRRALEKSLLAEAAFFVVFVMTSPFLVVWDRLRGRD